MKAAFVRNTSALPAAVLGWVAYATALCVVLAGCGGAAQSAAADGLRACLGRAGVVSNPADSMYFKHLVGPRPVAIFVVAPLGHVPDRLPNMFVYRDAAAARTAFRSGLRNGSSRSSNEILAGRVLAWPAPPADVPALERCLSAEHTALTLSPVTPGQPVPTPATADLSSGVRRLVARLRVFRRSQTAADRAGNRGLPPGYVPAFTRLVAALPHHRPVYLVVYVGVDADAYGSQVDQWSPSKVEPSLDPLPAVSYPSPASVSIGWESLVPNNVARFKFIWRPGIEPQAPGRVVTVTTPDNLAIAPRPWDWADYLEPPSSAFAYSMTGKVLAHCSPCLSGSPPSNAPNLLPGG